MSYPDPFGQAAPAPGPPAAYVPPPPFAPYAARVQPWAGPPGYPGYPGYPGPAGYQAAPGWGLPPAAAPALRPRLSFGVAGTSVAGIGFLMVVIALLGLPWFSIGGGLSTSDVRQFLSSRGEIANSLSVAYFSWFAWTLLLLAGGSAVVAALPRPALSLAFRIAGPLVAGFALLFTFGAIELTDTFYGDESLYFREVSAGFWVTLIGFALLGAGALLGPRRHYEASPPPAGASFQK